MASRGPRAAKKDSAARRSRARHRGETTPADEQAMLEALTDALFDRVLGPAWEQLGPLSAGAVATSVAIVGARGTLHRIFGRRYGRLLSWVGVAALVPVALWLLSGEGRREDSAPQRGDERNGSPPPSK